MSHPTHNHAQANGRNRLKPIIILTIAGLALSLSACQKPAAPAEEDSPPATVSTPSTTASKISDASVSNVQKLSDPIDVPQLAYEFAYRFAAPETALNTIMTTHQDGCLKSGPSVCQVVASDMSTDTGSTAQTHTLNRAGFVGGSKV